MRSPPAAFSSSLTGLVTKFGPLISGFLELLRFQQMSTNMVTAPRGGSVLLCRNTAPETPVSCLRELAGCNFHLAGSTRQAAGWGRRRSMGIGSAGKGPLNSQAGDPEQPRDERLRLPVDLRNRPTSSPWETRWRRRAGSWTGYSV